LRSCKKKANWPAQDHAVHALLDDRVERRAVALLAATLERTSNGGTALVYNPGWSFTLMTVLTLTTGSAFIMWLGEQISERGVGNGMSLIIFAGIVVGLPRAVGDLWGKARTEQWGPFTGW